MRSLLLVLLSCFAFSGAFSQLLITNVTVVDVENRRLLGRQQVLVQEGRIAALGTKVTAPAGVRRIDGAGKYLIPGLVDAHVHFAQSGGIYTRPDVVDLRKYRPYAEEIGWTHRNMEGFLRRYLRAGITTVIDVGSTVNFLKQRDTFRNRPYAPAVYMTGPLITTWEPAVYKGLKDDESFNEMKSVDDARNFVQRQLPYKPDFIKVWFIVNGRNTDSAARAHLPMVKAVIDESHKAGLRVAVHATERITAQLAVEAGADFLVHGIDDEPVQPSFVQLLKKKKVVLSPTLVVASNYLTALGQTYQLHSNDFHYGHSTPVNSIIDFKHLPDSVLREQYRQSIAAYRSKAGAADSMLRLNLKRLVDGGVTIATGTDAGNIGTHHVSSYYSELEAMQQSGMSTWQILQASTINGARAVGREAQFGSIAAGKQADLVLLRDNPLDSLSNWKSVEWVINKGVAWKPDSVLTYSAAEVVDRQALAYNARNLDLYLTTLHDSIQMYTLPSYKLDIQGVDSARKAYSFFNNVPDLYCRILNRIAEGSMVIDHEEVIFQKGRKPYYGIAMYYVEEGKIRKVYFYGEE